jgi:NitT/TauT family transport system substrate-binding protein
MNRSGLQHALTRYLVIIIGCLGINACSESSHQAFRIGTSLWPGYEPLFLARHNNYLDDDTRLVEYPNATQVLRAFRNRSLEAACLTLDEVLLLRQSKLPVTIILVTDISAGADAIIARPGIDSMRALNGRTIGVESSALGAYVISRALQKHNMTLDQVKIEHINLDQHQYAFDNPQIDAVVTYEPVRTQLLAMGGREIFSSKDLPGEIVDVMVINNKYLDSHRQQISRLVQGWFRALEDLQNNPRQSAQFISGRQKISADQVLASYQLMELPSLAENRKLLGGQDPELMHNIKRLKSVMVNQQLLQGNVSVSGLLTDEFLTARPY